MLSLSQKYFDAFNCIQRKILERCLKKDHILNYFQEYLSRTNSAHKILTNFLELLFNQLVQIMKENLP